MELKLKMTMEMDMGEEKLLIATTELRLNSGNQKLLPKGCSLLILKIKFWVLSKKTQCLFARVESNGRLGGWEESVILETGLFRLVLLLMNSGNYIQI